MFTAPASLSPSRVESFTSCPLAFRFAAIQKLPEPGSAATLTGTLVHRALELLFCHEPNQRTPEVARSGLEQGWDEVRSSDEFVISALDDDAASNMLRRAAALVDNYFEMEDPATVRAIGIEVKMAAEIDGLLVRGIIDRLELSETGDLVVTDYKTGRTPSFQYEQRRLGGVHFYAFLCEQLLGQRPAEVRLMYLSSGETITAYPSEQSIRFLQQRTSAVHRAIVRACENGDFRARSGPLCASCAFRDWCPEFGGDPTLAAVEAPRRYAPAAA